MVDLSIVFCKRLPEAIRDSETPKFRLQRLQLHMFLAYVTIRYYWSVGSTVPLVWVAVDMAVDMSIYPCSTHVDPITSVAVYIVYIPIAAKIENMSECRLVELKVISHHIPPCCWIWSCWWKISILALLHPSPQKRVSRVQLSAPAGKFPGNGLAYQWSIFHGKTAEACTRKTKKLWFMVIWHLYHLLIWFKILKNQQQHATTSRDVKSSWPRKPAAWLFTMKGHNSGALRPATPGTGDENVFLAVRQIWDLGVSKTCKNVGVQTLSRTPSIASSGTVVAVLSAASSCCAMWPCLRCIVLPVWKLLRANLGSQALTNWAAAPWPPQNMFDAICDAALSQIIMV